MVRYPYEVLLMVVAYLCNSIPLREQSSVDRLFQESGAIMDRLPVEILQHICSFLCCHCQFPDQFPNADTGEVRTAKSALASLCAVSRSVHDAAQPILYHYYATGNLPIVYKDYTDFPEEDDKLPAFLHTIIRRPDLAQHVKALQLVSTQNISGCTRELVQIFNEASEKLGISVHRPKEEDWGESSRSDFAIEKPYYSRPHMHALSVHHWLEELAILLLPNVTMLFVARDWPGEYSCIFESGRTLPSLKTLALIPNQLDNHIFSADDLFKAARNLETLYAISCGAEMVSSSDDEFLLWYEHRQGSSICGLPVSLKKLVISGIEGDDLALILEGCSEVIDLHYILDRGDRSSEGCEGLLDALNPISKTLQQLHIKMSGPCEFESYLSFEDSLPDNYATIETLERFTNLEKLVIDQASIYCPSFPSDEASCVRLAGLFPQSIQEISLTFVYKAFNEDLERLAQEAPWALPNLRTVRIMLVQDDVDDADEESMDEFDWWGSLEPLFAASGIQFSCGKCRLGGPARTLVPGMTVGSTCVQFPAFE